MRKSLRSLRADFCMLFKFCNCLLINHLMFYIALRRTSDLKSYMLEQYPLARPQKSIFTFANSFCHPLFCALSMCNFLFSFSSLDWFYFLLYFAVAFNAFFIFPGRRCGRCFLRFTSQPQLAICTVSRIRIRSCHLLARRVRLRMWMGIV